MKPYIIILIALGLVYPWLVQSVLIDRVSTRVSNILTKRYENLVQDTINDTFRNYNIITQ